VDKRHGAVSSAGREERLSTTPKLVPEQTDEQNIFFNHDFKT
jgi:hypothetical protein